MATLPELGVVFLLFDVGLHFSFARVRERAADILGFGPIQVLLGTLFMAVRGSAYGLGLGPALLVGLTLSLSSTAVVARLVAERHQQNCPVGVTATTILVFQDIAAIALLIVVSTLGHGGNLFPAIGIAFFKAVPAISVALFLSRIVVEPLLTAVVRAERRNIHRNSPNDSALRRVGDSLYRIVAFAWRLSRRHDPVGDSLSRGAAIRSHAVPRIVAGFLRVLDQSGFYPIIGGAPFSVHPASLVAANHGNRLQCGHACAGDGTQPIAAQELRCEVSFDTSSLADGPHKLTICAQNEHGHEGVKEISFVVHNGPGIGVSGLHPHAICRGEVRFTVDAFSVDDPFDPRRAEARSSIPVWIWVMTLFVIAWAVWYAARMWDVPAKFAHSPTYSSQALSDQKPAPQK